MNRMLVAVFDTPQGAESGLQALHHLNDSGDITLYASGVISKSAQGGVSVQRTPGTSPVGAATGLAVGSLIGLLGGPVGLVVGALTGAVVGAVRDFWVAGVGLDFVEEAGQLLRPGKVALVAEIEEEWVIPVDSALEALGGQVLRRARSEVAEAQYDHDIQVVRNEIKALESEASHAQGGARLKLQARMGVARRSLDAAVQRAQLRVDALKQEADDKAVALKQQLAQVQGSMHARIEDRVKRVKTSYHARGAKLAQAWTLTKAALAG